MVVGEDSGGEGVEIFVDQFFDSFLLFLGELVLAGIFENMSMRLFWIPVDVVFEFFECHGRSLPWVLVGCQVGLVL